jgi:hypothetical protein
MGGTSNQPNRPMIYGHYAPQAQGPRRSVAVGFTNNATVSNRTDVNSQKLNSKITAMFPVVVPRSGDGTSSPAIPNFLQALMGGQSPRDAIDDLLQNPRGSGIPVLPAIGYPDHSPCTLPPVGSSGQSQPTVKIDCQKRSAPRYYCWARQCNGVFKSRSELKHHIGVHHQCLRLLLIDPYPGAGKPGVSSRHRGGAPCSQRQN